MDSRKIKTFFLVFLALAALITGIYAFSNRYMGDSISDSELHDLTGILSRSGITLAEGALDRTISTRGELVSVSFDRERYALSVAERISGSPRRTLQMTEDGCIITSENGTVVTVTSDFVLRCFTGVSTDGDYVPAGNEETASAIEMLFRLFGGVDGEFADSRLSYRVDSVSVCRKTGIVQVIFSQTWEGMPLEGFGGLAYLRGEALLEFEGVWCFLSFSDSASSQLYSSLNILLSESTRRAGQTSEPRRLTDVAESRAVLRGGGRIYLVPAMRLIYEDGGVSAYNRVTGELLSSR